MFSVAHREWAVTDPSVHVYLGYLGCTKDRNRTVRGLVQYRGRAAIVISNAVSCRNTLLTLATIKLC